MRLRDEAEAVLKGWDELERERGRAPIIDFDCTPDGAPPAQSIADRIEVQQALQELVERARLDGDDWVARRLDADLTYVNALLGERLDLDTYVTRTQGCGTSGWSADYIDWRRSQAVDALDGLGIAWTADTNTELEDSEGRLSVQETAEQIQAQATELEPAVRALAGTEAQFNLKVEELRIDAYWAYWLDGIGSEARLRINLEHAQFTKVRARQLALHEILGHALQAASYYHHASNSDVPWIRLLSVHAPQQVLLEGLAQALPLFVTPDESDLIARTRLTHYLQLVRSEVHREINNGSSPAECISYAQKHVPFWSGEAIADMLDDRANNVQLRSYLWSYPAGMDWFVQLAEDDGAPVAEIFSTAYEAPLQPTYLARLWPTGPPCGGSSMGGAGHRVSSDDIG